MVGYYEEIKLFLMVNNIMNIVFRFFIIIYMLWFKI